MVKSLEPLNSEEIGPLKEKLEKCRNQDNNPDSEMWGYLGNITVEPILFDVEI